jgi:hypothetical protein
MNAVDRVLKAYHEAGHAVAAHCLGREVIAMSIVPDMASAGRVTYTPAYDSVLELEIAPGIAKPLHEALDGLLEQDAVILLAGSVAAHCVAASLAANGIAPDAAGISGESADIENALAIAAWVGYDGEQAEDYVCRAGLRAAALLRTHWPAVQGLASALLRLREIDGRLAMEIIQSSPAARQRGQAA